MHAIQPPRKISNTRCELCDIPCQPFFKFVIDKQPTGCRNNHMYVPSIAMRCSSLSSTRHDGIDSLSVGCEGRSGQFTSRRGGIHCVSFVANSNDRSCPGCEGGRYSTRMWW